MYTYTQSGHSVLRLINILTQRKMFSDALASMIWHFSDIINILLNWYGKKADFIQDMSRICIQFVAHSW